MSEATLPAPSEIPPGAPKTGDSPARAIGLILLSSFLFVAMNTIVKLEAAHLSATEIGFFRQVVSLLPIGWAMRRAGGLVMLRTRRPLGHLFRGTIGNLAMIPYILSLAWLPLADATTLSFASPLFVTALSMPLLGEPVGRHRWVAVILGFAGIVVITHPSAAWLGTGAGSRAGAGAGMGVLAAFLSALMMITIRQLGRTEAPVTTVFYFALIGCLVFGATLPFVWVVPRPWEWVGLAAIGMIGGAAQLVMTHAYRAAPAATLAPFGYSSILWGTAFGFMVWDQLPGRQMIAGAAIVVASGLYIVYRETRRRARPNAAEAVAAQA